MNAVKNFRDNVRREYKHRGIRQDALAVQAGITSTALNRILMGHSIPQLDTCEAIANALEIPLESLLSENAEILST